jgi:hypothetical protein
MTTLAEMPPAVVDPPPRQRRIWLRVVVGVLVLTLIGAGTSWLIFINTYQPLTFGSGPVGSATPKTLKTIGDGIQDTNSIVVGPAGTKGTADYTILNGGHFSVTLLGIDSSLRVFGQVLTWTPINPPGGEAGLPSEGRAFPVTIKPGDEVVVQDTVTKPQCPGGPGTVTESITDIPIRWSALGVHHVWDVGLQDVAGNLPITVCPPKSALAHVTND